MLGKCLNLADTIPLKRPSKSTINPICKIWFSPMLHFFIFFYKNEQITLVDKSLVKMMKVGRDVGTW